MNDSYLKSNDLTVQQLRWFCQVYELGSFAAAARQSGYAPPTLWEQVRKLEKKYGEKLFDRKGRNIQPTHAADLLYKTFVPVLATLDSSFERARELTGPTRTVLNIVTGMRMMLEELAPILIDYQKGNPHVELRLQHGDDKTARSLIVADQADLGLTLEPGPSIDADPVVIQRAYDLKYLAVFPARHPLAKKAQISLKDLVRYPLVVGSHGTQSRMVLDQSLHREELLDRRNIAIETTNSAITVACVRAGAGVGVMAGLANSPLTHGLKTHSLAESLGHAHVVFVTKKGRQLTNTIRGLMKVINAGMDK
ncbi:LysR family transcriptional regulator [Bythopirellula polymerisocia]|uniref:HTH-type transcriptional regulator CysB n=1 Tax=Bythopirellula polymerisocia TaxID=2528003 RepID=A0A5C6CVU0_9BACT|nr:LysR family transcriptional regulator [Bythopirellula polymerisocia]TWU28700.1 HTH-type transcriptional regulator CysB [Bythopirellula polymerisocia]